MASGASIGMMDPAYFVGRKQILAWLNETFSMSLTKIEETASGAVACQMLDRLYGRMPMHRVRWDARTPPDMTANWKIVQSALAKKGVDRDIPIERLVRAKYQDNLEMMQWFKHFYESNVRESGEEYDALGRRKLGRGADKMSIYEPGGGIRADSKVGTTRRSAAAAGARREGGGSARKAGGGGGGGGSSAKPVRSGRSGGSGPSTGSATGPAAGALAVAKKKLAESRVVIDGLEKERDFYFSKLRDIEILAQTYKGDDKPFVDQIFKILYATEDDFVVPDETADAAQDETDATMPTTAPPDAPVTEHIPGDKENATAEA